MRAAAIVAAAGSSTRMGRPKALLPWDSTQTFLERVLRVLHTASVERVVVTLPNAPSSPELLRALTRVPDQGARIVVENRHPHEGLSGSVRTALEELRDAEALLVWPIDCPFADAGLVRALLDGVAPLDGHWLAAVPHVDGERGHPVVFTSDCFEVLARANTIGGPRGLITTLGVDVLDVPWSDPRVAHDVDTPEDYKNLFGRAL